MSHSLRSGGVQSLLHCLYRRVGFSSSSGSVGVTVGSSGAVPSRKLLRFSGGLGLPVLSMVRVLFDLFPVLPCVFSPGVGRGSLSRV